LRALNVEGIGRREGWPAACRSCALSCLLAWLPHAAAAADAAAADPLNALSSPWPSRLDNQGGPSVATPHRRTLPSMKGKDTLVAPLPAAQQRLHWRPTPVQPRRWNLTGRWQHLCSLPPPSSSSLPRATLIHGGGCECLSSARPGLFWYLFSSCPRPDYLAAALTNGARRSVSPPPSDSCAIPLKARVPSPALPSAHPLTLPSLCPDLHNPRYRCPPCLSPSPRPSLSATAARRRRTACVQPFPAPLRHLRAGHPPSRA
jgi:hypothetical protein